MEIKFYHIDAFTDRAFSGNPAGVCFLEAWLDEAVLHSIAAEINLSETAFLVPTERHYELRWFTPKMEVDLCGHATLASAFAVMEYITPRTRKVDFQTKSGPVSVENREGLLLMNFPARPAKPFPMPEGIGEILGVAPQETFLARDLLAVYEREDEIQNLRPDLARLSTLDYFAVIVTAPGEKSDFVSRFFAPAVGVPEDPVTGSAHCTLIPYWSERLGKKRLYARQLSERGGELFCTDRGDRVSIGGRAVLVLSGTIRI
jgi:PhzF family phenazine biosynthesis protein